jgi:ferric-dicitrate binding protein FerR (iron transport regulator)
MNDLDVEPPDEGDPLWQAAWRWVLLEHEHLGLDAERLAQRQAWLDASPRHADLLAQARRIWLLAGMVPPRHRTDE